jgi:hypothetical protein
MKKEKTAKEKLSELKRLSIVTWILVFLVVLTIYGIFHINVIASTQCHQGHDPKSFAASNLNGELSTYYAAIKTGLIYREDYAKTIPSDADKLPSKNAETPERREAALRCTIQGALEFSKLELGYDLSEFRFVKGKSVVYHYQSEYCPESAIPLSPTTTLMELGFG